MTTTEAGSTPQSIIQTENDEDEIIDIPLLLEHTENSNSSIYTEWSNCCIYRVPKKLRSVNEAAYTPQIVSIGPFHHGKPELKPMEKLKSRYLDEFCRRTRKTHEEIKSIFDSNCEKSIRACYAGTFHLNNSNFLDMIITDATFIIELLLRSLEGNEDDYILSKPWLRKSVEQDIIILENQLPFFVLEMIYNFSSLHASFKPKSTQKDNKFRTENDQYKKCSPCFTSICSDGFRAEYDENSVKISSNSEFLRLTCEYFSNYHLKYEGSISIPQVKHFTDLLRHYFCPPGQGVQYEPNRENRIQSLRNAIKLDEAGVNFEAVDKTYLNNIKFENNRCVRHCPCFNCSWLIKCLPCFFERLPHIKYTQPTLKLPRFDVNDTTECVFRNLMALEQCHYPNEVYVCNYVSLMDKLINTSEDVELLIDKKVIVNFLGSNKALAELFNSLCKQIVELNSCYNGCVKEINNHCNDPLNRIMATLTSVYFKDFWRGTATVVGIIVLLLTVWNFTRRLMK